MVRSSRVAACDLIPPTFSSIPTGAVLSCRRMTAESPQATKLAIW